MKSVANHPSMTTIYLIISIFHYFSRKSRTHYFRAADTPVIYACHARTFILTILKNLPGTKGPHSTWVQCKKLFGLSVRRKQSPHTPWRVGMASLQPGLLKNNDVQTWWCQCSSRPFFPSCDPWGLCRPFKQPIIRCKHRLGWLLNFHMRQGSSMNNFFSLLPSSHIPPLMPPGGARA